MKKNDGSVPSETNRSKTVNEESIQLASVDLALVQEVKTICGTYLGDSLNLIVHELVYSQELLTLTGRSVNHRLENASAVHGMIFSLLYRTYDLYRGGIRSILDRNLHTWGCCARALMETYGLLLKSGADPQVWFQYVNGRNVGGLIKAAKSKLKGVGEVYGHLCDVTHPNFASLKLAAKTDPNGIPHSLQIPPKISKKVTVEYMTALATQCNFIHTKVEELIRKYLGVSLDKTKTPADKE